MDYSVKEGSTYSVMSGFGNAFMTALALRLGAGTVAIGLLQSLPTLLYAGVQLFVGRLIETVRDRKKFVLIFVTFQAFLWLPMVLLALYTSDHTVWLVVLFYSLVGVCEAFINPAWVSWISDIVPARKRGLYFGRRNEVTGFVALASTFAAGYTLGFFESFNAMLGFAVIFLVAFVARLVSLFFMNKMMEPGYRVDGNHRVGFSSLLKEMRKTNFGILVIYASALSFAVNLSSPFFDVYMLQNLKFDYFAYTLVTAASAFFTLITMPYWGRVADRLGNKFVLNTTGFLVALVPFFWILSPNLLYIIAFHVIVGLAWSGQRLATFNLVIATTPRENRVRYVTYYNFFTGLSLFAGALLGGFLAIAFASVQFLWLGGLLLLFLVSGILRFVVAATLLQKVKEVEVRPKASEKHFLLKTVTIYPLRSVMHEFVSFERAVSDGLAKRKGLF